MELFSFIAATIRTSSPLLLAALGGLFMARSGIINIGIEGTMLFGSLAGVLGAYTFHGPFLGSLTAIIVGGIVGLLFAYLVVGIGVNQLIVGMAINLLAMGLTTVIFRIKFGEITTPCEIKSFTILKIPCLHKILGLGAALFEYKLLVYVAYILVPVISWIFFKTVMGLRIRAVGEYPKAADTLGINVFKVRYIACIVGGMLIGLAGAYLSICDLSMFTENMTSGKGFMALTIIIFGRWRPWGVLIGALLFGAAEALQLRLQIQYSNIPYQLLSMLPYILTVLVLSSIMGKIIQPAATCKVYKRESEE